MARPARLGPYRIDEPLGKGGMGAVYAATHLDSGERVAVKALSPELAMAEGFRERFEAEIESLRILQHDSIVQLYGYGEDAGTLFYSMEIVDGASLEEELRAGRRFNWREVTHIGIQMCRALKHAHDHGVVHRDIKPANILLDSQERVKLADFGIARLFGSTQLTSAGGVLGTADFMSPEQADGRPVTDRCDQYSLGCVMYALLAGRPPFRAKTLPEMLQLQRYAEPEPVRRYAPQTPVHLEQAIMQLLEKEPENRFPNALVLARHFEAMTLALSKPGRDDFHVNDQPGGTLVDQAVAGTEEDNAVTQLDPNLSDAPSLSPPGATPATSHVREQATHVAPEGTPADSTEQPQASQQSFTVVGSEDSGTGSSSLWSTVGPITLMILLLAIMGGVGYSMFRPPTADELFDKLSAYPESTWVASNSIAEKQLDSFLKRFPNDPRIEQLQPRIDQIGGSQLERRLRAASLRNETTDDRLNAAEQLYVRALRMERRAPTAAAHQYKQLATLLSPDSADTKADDTNADNAQLATLVSQRLARLKHQLEKDAEQHLPFAKSRLAAAKEVARKDGQKAAAICEALITTYGDRPWAKSLVQEAQALLDSLD